MKLGLALSFVTSFALGGSYGLRLPLTRRDSGPPHGTSVNVTAIEQTTADPFTFVKRSTTYSAVVDIEGQPFTVRSRHNPSCDCNLE